MIILDLNQVMISSLMGSLSNNNDIDENLIRHMILNSIRMNKKKFEEEYGELIIACDGKNNWRKKVFPYYKAGRKKNREESKLDWNNIFSVLNKVRDELRDFFPYRVINVEGSEADDIIGVLCKEHGKQLGGDPILILSGDKDFIQLHTYSNVSQYDPVRKRWINNEDPVRYAVEHVLRGDASDGVPNFLSSDDTFVSNSRQRQLRKKVIDEILAADWPEDWSGMNEELLRNYNRNKMLIDLSHTPDDIRETILREYQEQSGKDRSKLFNYFIKYRLKNLMENINEF